MNAPTKTVRCPNCGESNPATRTLCWLCYGALGRGSLRHDVEPEPLVESSAEESPASLVALMIALAVICMGVLLIAPGLGITMAVLLIVPFIRTTILVKRRSDEGKTTSTASSVGMFLGSIFVSWIVLTVVSVVAFGTFCLTCLGVVGLDGSGPDKEILPMLIAGGATLVAVSGVGLLLFRWVRSRWHRDLQK